MSASEERLRVRDKYRTILGRNHYSQARRSCVFQRASDGKYYSDCSSSVAACYRYCGYPIRYGGSSLPNTVGIYNSTDVVEVPVTIQSGVIQNPEALRVGDLLLFAGSDSARASSGYVGHVELVGEFKSGKVLLYGHGSGTPRVTEMHAYCRSRYAQKTGTKRGNKGLIKVVRRIADDDASVDPHPSVSEKPVAGAAVKIENCRECNIRTGPGTQYASIATAKTGAVFSAPESEGWVPIVYNGSVRWVSQKYAKTVN